MFGFLDSLNQTDDDPSRAKTTDDYIKMVESGLPPDDVARMREAYDCLRYSLGYFDALDASRGDGYQAGSIPTSERFDPIPNGDDMAYAKAPLRIGLPVMRRVVGALSRNLYRRQPTRKFRDKQVGELLEAIYQRNGMGAKWQRADQFTAIGGFSAFQFAGSDDPKSPVRVQLWSADQLVVWTAPDDHETPQAVVTLDQVDGRTRATLWTEDSVIRFTTKRNQYAAHGQPRKFEVTSRGANPYRDPDGKGIIPFAFIHFDHPTTEFSTTGPGKCLRDLNEYINFGFDDMADGLRYIIKPIGLAEGVDEAWSPPSIIKPGMFLNLAAGQIDAGGNGPQPQLRYLESPNSWVGVVWSHLNNYLDLSLELNNVPPSAVRMVLDARSGVSILAEQAPLLAWTEERRRSFLTYEERVAVKALEVLAAHLRNHARDAKRFDALALDPGFQLRWPRLYTDLPGPERDRADGTRIQWGVASLVDLVMEREDCTREQALEQLERVKADNDQLEAMGINPLPDVLKSQGGGGGGGFGNFGGGPPADGGDEIASQPQAGIEGPDSGVTGQPVDQSTQADALSGEGG